MDREENRQFISNFFEQTKRQFTRLIETFVDDTNTVLEEAASIFEGMIPDMAYVDKPHTTMAAYVLAGC